MIWVRITQRYNAKWSSGNVQRNVSMLSNHFVQACEQIQKFNGWYINEIRTSGSGTIKADIMTAVMSRPVKHVYTWKKVRHLDNWAGGIQSSSDSTSKWSRSQASLLELIWPFCTAVHLGGKQRKLAAWVDIAKPKCPPKVHPLLSLLSLLLLIHTPY